MAREPQQLDKSSMLFRRVQLLRELWLPQLSFLEAGAGGLTGHVDYIMSDLLKSIEMYCTVSMHAEFARVAVYGVCLLANLQTNTVHQ